MKRQRKVTSALYFRYNGFFCFPVLRITGFRTLLGTSPGPRIPQQPLLFVSLPWAQGCDVSAPTAAQWGWLKKSRHSKVQIGIIKKKKIYIAIYLLSSLFTCSFLICAPFSPSLFKHLLPQLCPSRDISGAQAKGKPNSSSIYMGVLILVINTFTDTVIPSP